MNTSFHWLEISYLPRFSGNHDPMEFPKWGPIHIVISSEFSNSNVYFRGPIAGRCWRRNIGGTLAAKSLKGVISIAGLPVLGLFSAFDTLEWERKASKTLFETLFWHEGCGDSAVVILVIAWSMIYEQYKMQTWQSTRDKREGVQSLDMRPS